MGVFQVLQMYLTYQMIHLHQRHWCFLVADTRHTPGYTPVVVIPTGEGGEKTKHRWQEFCKIILGKIFGFARRGACFPCDDQSQKKSGKIFGNPPEVTSFLVRCDIY